MEKRSKAEKEELMRNAYEKGFKKEQLFGG